MPFRQKLNKPGKDDESYKFTKKKGGKQVGGARVFTALGASLKSMKKL